MNMPKKLLFLVMSCLAPTLHANELDCTKHPSLGGWTKGELIYHENFDTLNDWFSEGNVKISNPNGKLKIQTFGSNSVNKGNVWSLKEFSGPYYIEWSFKEVDPASLNLMFWGARKVDGSDFFSNVRNNDFNWVVDSDIESYHISYSRGLSGWTHVHKNPGFHNLVPDETVMDPLRTDDGNWHTIGIYQQSGHILIFIDSTLVHDIDENSDFGSCFVCYKKSNHKDYDVANPCRRDSHCPGLNSKKKYVHRNNSSFKDETGKHYIYSVVERNKAYSYLKGRIGFRHQRGASLYDDLKIWRLIPPDSKQNQVNN